MDVSERLIFGDITAGSDFYESRKGPNCDAPLRRLMNAMLGDALECIKKGASGPVNASQRREAEAAEEWVNDTSDEYIFSFNCVCESLGIHPGALRESLSKWILDGPRLTRRPPVVRATSVSISPYRRRRRTPDARGLR
jgi:hypothetical protein